jgi:hypothetical protein
MKTQSMIFLRNLIWLEKVSIAISVYFVFFPKPYEIAFIAVVSMPIIGCFINRLDAKSSILSLFRIKEDRKGQNDYVLAGFIKYPVLSILFRILYQFELENNYSLLLPGTITFCIIMTILGLSHKMGVPSDLNYLSIYFPILFFVGIYSYSATFGINCIFDKSKPTIYETKVIEKDISISKGKHYYITVKPWGNLEESRKLSVSLTEYENAEVGKSIEIAVADGLLKMSWFYVN